MATPLQSICLCFALISALIASYEDLYSRRIPNKLTGPAILVRVPLYLTLIAGGAACLAGTANVTNTLLAAVLAGAAAAVALVIGRGRITETVTNVVALVKHQSALGLIAHLELEARSSSTPRRPYALPTAAGCYLATALVTGNGRTQ